MEVYLNKIDGIDDAIISMFLSKRTLTRELEMKIRNIVSKNTYLDVSSGQIVGALKPSATEDAQLKDWLDKVFNYGVEHTTLLRFIDLSFTVYNLHRGGQDDWDAHSKRFDNRIVRSSTRLGDFNKGEMSEWYQGKILPTDLALTILGLELPETITYEGKPYVRSANGYILKGHENDRDYKRGLYMLSIPSSFIFKIQLPEFCHVYRERNEDGTANPEVKLLAENCASQLYKATMGYMNRNKIFAIRQ